MKTLANSLLSSASAALLAVGFTFASPAISRAADHGDAPALAHDQGADIADVYTFMDPKTPGNVVIIGTVHGFIVPGEAGNFAAFDNNVKYRFEIYNKHVNMDVPVLPPNPTIADKIKFARDNAAYLKAVAPNRTIDVSFSKRVVNDAADTKINLAKPGPQSAVLTLGGFKGAAKRGIYAKTKANGDILTNPVTLAKDPVPLTPSTIAFDGSNDIQFFAGEVDDPFFFDLVGFSRLINSIHEIPHTADATVLNRARDTFAGYNVLAIALSIPKALLLDDSGAKLGVDFLTQRHNVEITGKDGVTGSGGYKTVDRMGNPAVNVALIPYNKKNAYNASSAKNDASLKASTSFAGDIIETLHELGTSDANIGALAGIAVFRGDILLLDPTANGGFPNGRKLTDDVIDTILSVVVGSPIGDGVNANDSTFGTDFPFLAVPHQPLDSGVDDNTRN